jgi:hypothetical protein
MAKIGNSMITGRRFLLIVLGWMIAAAGAFGQDNQVTASISNDSIGTQDQLQFSITVSGNEIGTVELPRQLPIKGFKIVSGPNISTQFQWINGQTSNSKSFGYILIPEKEGQFTIDPVEIRVKGKIYKTQPIQVRVTSAPRTQQKPQRQNPVNPFDPFGEERSPQNRQPVGDAVMIKAELDKNSVYLGQQATLVYKIYDQVGVSGFEWRESPALSGFWIEDIQIDKNPKPTRQMMNGREYRVYTIKKQALFANKTGRITIPPSTFAISARTGGDPFGMFGGTETLYRKTQELSLEVKPLPEEGRPPHFNNAVGTFTLAADIDKKQASAGEAVALHIKLAGKGNLKMIPDIQLPSLPDFTIYSSKRADNLRPFEQDQVGGDKDWEYIIVPKAPGSQTIPSLSFSYFNADKNKYETAATPALALTVTSGADNSSSPGLTGANKQDLKRRGSDINFIKLSPGKLEKEEAPFYHQAWMYLILVFPLLFNAGAFVYQRRRSLSFENAGLARSRKAKRKALSQLKMAEKEGKFTPRRFYDLASCAFTGYLADKFNRTGIELTGDRIAHTLSEISVSPETIEETQACLRECDFGRFVSAAQSPDKMQSLSARIRKVIDSLETYDIKGSGLSK